MESRFSHLLSPIRLGNVEVRNRLVSTAHLTRLGEGRRVGQQMIAYHVARARGGIGLIILEASAVHPTTRKDPTWLVGWDEQAVPHYRLLAEAVHQHGAKIFAQVWHGGRSAADSMDSLLPIWSASRVVVAPQGRYASEVAHAMTRQEIEEVVRAFAQCAANMKRAGMDGVEVHAGHRYLIEQFLSPLTNRRTDEYGGSLRNRARFALEVAHAVRRAVGRDLAVGMRISAEDPVPGGLTLEHMTQVSQWLEEAGDLDFLDVSRNDSLVDMSWPQACFVHLARGIKQATRGIPVIAVGRIIDPVVAENIIASGWADMVAMTRAHIADPDIGRKLMEGRPEDIRQCLGGMEGCADRVRFVKSVGCTINPEAGREHELEPITRAPHGKAVVVVGGGPAGMEAARVAALRGHTVVLYERQGRLGGQVNTLVKAPYRQDYGNVVAWLEFQLKRLGVVVKLNAEATPDRLREEGPEAVVVATGSRPQLPDIPGTREPGGVPLASVYDVLEGRVPQARHAVVLDRDWHQKAASTVEFLAERGARVHVVTELGDVFEELMRPRPLVMKRLKQRRVAFHRDSWVKRVEGQRVTLQDVYNGEEQAIDQVDLLVAAVPNTPDQALADALRRDGEFPAVLSVGDCVAPRRVMEAIRDGHRVGRAV